MQLNSTNVVGVFNLCALSGEMQNNADAIKIDGIRHSVIFHRPTLEECRDKIESMIDQLPEDFHEKGGGGQSFLNMCTDDAGDLWTGEHAVMEMLLLLGIGIGVMDFRLPKSLWKTLPGRMPYVYIKHKVQYDEKNT